MKFSLLFWNLADKDLSRLLAEAIQEHDIHLAVVCEANSLSKDFLQEPALQGGMYREIDPVTLNRVKLRFFAKRSPKVQFEIVHESQTGRLVICRLVFPAIELLVAGVHLDSKVNSSDYDQWVEAQILADELRNVEKRFGHQQTLAIGDFNMNPFEPAIFGSKGFHAVMDKRTANEIKRTVKSREYPFFYNPMWGRFGDLTIGPPGTHYFRESEHHVLFWNMFDQVLLRPELLSYFHDQIDILKAIGDENICSSEGRPSKSIASDHFPIVTQLQLP